MSEFHQSMEELNQGTQDVVRILKWFFRALTLLMAAAVVAYLLSGFFILESGRHAAVYRFGKLVRVETEEGWYLCMPKYIDRIEKVEVERRNKLAINDFWYAVDPQNVTAPQGGSANNDPLIPGKDGYHLTADNNIMHSKWSLVYNVDELRQYITASTSPEEALHQAMRNAVVKASSQIPVDTMLSDAEGQFRLLAKQELIRQVREMKVGLAIIEVNLLEKSVPQSTQEALNAVTNASNERNAMENTARGLAATQMEQAKAESRRLMEDAKAYRRNIENSVIADAEYMSKVLPEYKASGASILLPEYVNTLLTVVEKVDRVMVLYPDQEVRVTIEPRMDAPIKPNGPEEQNK